MSLGGRRNAVALRPPAPMRNRRTPRAPGHTRWPAPRAAASRRERAARPAPPRPCARRRVARVGRTSRSVRSREKPLRTQIADPQDRLRASAHARVDHRRLHDAPSDPRPPEVDREGADVVCARRNANTAGQGAGTVHHVAWGTTEPAQEQWLARLTEVGLSTRAAWSRGRRRAEGPRWRPSRRRGRPCPSRAAAAGSARRRSGSCPRSRSDRWGTADRRARWGCPGRSWRSSLRAASAAAYRSRTPGA